MKRDPQRLGVADVNPLWLLLNVTALGFSLAHVQIDWQIGLFGSSSSHMSLQQAALIFFTGLLYGWWGLSLVSGGLGKKVGLVSLFIFSFGWSFLTNGAFALAACPPPCPNAFPYQDIAHLGNFVFGGMAAYITRKAVTQTPGPIGWTRPTLSVVMLLLPYVAEAVVFLRMS